MENENCKTVIHHNPSTYYEIDILCLHLRLNLNYVNQTLPLISPIEGSLHLILKFTVPQRNLKMGILP